MFQTLARTLTRALEVVIVANLAIMAVLVFGNVVLRYAFNSGIAVSEELARLLFVWLIFLGAIVASRQHAHIGFDTLVRRMPPAAQKVVILLTGLLLLTAAVMFIIGGWKQTVINFDNTYPVLGISYGWLYGVAIVFGIGLALAVLANLWEAFTGPDEPDELVMTQNIGDRIADKMPQVAKDRK